MGLVGGNGGGKREERGGVLDVLPESDGEFWGCRGVGSGRCCYKDIFGATETDAEDRQGLMNLICYVIDVGGTFCVWRKPVSMCAKGFGA